MISLAILLLPEAYLSAVYGIKEIIEYASKVNGKNIFSVSLETPDDFRKTEASYDIVVIPPFRMDPEFKIDSELVASIRKAHKSGTVIASVCAGAFYLCATGIADSRTVTTHWMLSGKLKDSFPAVDVRKEKILIDNGSFVTGGGISSFQDLALYFIRRYISPETAVETAKVFLIDPTDRSQLEYMMLNLDIRGTDPVLRNAVDFIKRNYLEDITVDSVAEACSVTKRTLMRRFEKYSSYSPGEYIRHLRLDYGKTMLEHTSEPIKTIAYKTGYSDIVAFNRMFKKTFGITPGLIILP